MRTPGAAGLRVAARCAAALLLAAGLAPGAAAAAAAPDVARIVAEADAAFARDDYTRARALYEQAVAAGAEAVHPLQRLALLESWDGDLAESVRDYRRALERAPGDLDLSLELAKVLSWRNDLRESTRVYGELRTRFPDDARVLLGLARVLAWRGRYADAEAIYRDLEDRRIEPIQAHLGRARALAWRGQLAQAAHFYRDVLRADAGNADARLGLAEVEHWQGLDRAAKAQADNLVLDHPESREARDLQARIHEALDPRGGVDAYRFSDNDSNRVEAGTLSTTFMAEPQTSVRIDFTDLRAQFRCRDAALCDGDPGAAAQIALGQPVDAVVDARAEALTAGVVSRLIGPLTFHARLGAAREEIFGGGARALAIGGGYIRWQVGPRFALVGSGARDAFFDTAPLIDRGLHADSADILLEYRFRPDWTLSGSAGAATYSDGNGRRTAGLSIVWRLPVAHPYLSGTFDARYRAFNETRSDGYFDPRRYDAELLTAAVWDSYRKGRLTWRLEGTAGRQAFAAAAGSGGIGSGDTVRAVYASFGVGFGTRAEVEAYYSHSNYAAQIATGFTSSRAGVAFRMRF